MMFQVGITGGIGSGKTLVCSVLEKMGVAVYNADSAARRLMEQDPGLVRGIFELFGEEAYLGGTLNRRLLAERVFGNEQLLKRLNALVHPVVRRDYLGWVNRQKESPYVVEEAAILFESGANRWLDMTVMVYAPVSVRVRRVMDRDGVSREQVLKRMSHQMDDEQKRAKADLVIVNDGNEMLLPQITEVHQRILNSR